MPETTVSGLPALWKVRLETSDGHFVSRLSCLPFTPPPDVLVWGSRTFKLYQKWEENAKEDIFRECFCYWVPPGSELEGDDHV